MFPCQYHLSLSFHFYLIFGPPLSTLLCFCPSSQYFCTILNLIAQINCTLDHGVVTLKQKDMAFSLQMLSQLSFLGIYESLQPTSEVDSIEFVQSLEKMGALKEHLKYFFVDS